MGFGTSVVTCTDPDVAYSINIAKSVRSLSIQHKPGNTGIVYLGLAGMDTSTMEDVLQTMPPPQTYSFPGMEVSDEPSPNGVDASQLYVASSVGGDVVVVSYEEF